MLSFKCLVLLLALIGVNCTENANQQSTDQNVMWLGGQNDPYVLNLPKILNINMTGKIEVVHSSTAPIKVITGSCNDTSGNNEKESSKTYYYISTTKMCNFWQAIQFCSLHGMQLVSIETMEENDFLHDSLHTIFNKKGQEYFWTSGTRLPDGTNYVWLSTGLPLDYTNWVAGEPNNVNNIEKCLNFMYKPVERSSIVWYDNPCDSTSYPMCETNVKKPITLTSVLGLGHSTARAQSIEEFSITFLGERPQ